MKYDLRLAELITALNKSEKRYFKIDASRHIMGTENNYVKLFNLINQQKDHSKVFDKTPGRNLSALKGHLYQFALKSMRGYSEKSSGYSRINGLLSDVYYLYTKGLYLQCQILLDKAKKIAYTYERFEQLINIIYWQKIFFIDDRGLGQNKLQKLFQEEQRILQILKDIHELEAIKQKILDFESHKGYTRTRDEIKMLNGFMRNPIMKSFPNNSALRLNIQYYVICSLYYSNLHQLEESYKYGKKIVELFESKPLLMQEYFKAYLGLVHNLMISQRKLNRIPELFRGIYRLREISTDSLHKASAIFATSYHTELSVHLNRGAFANALKLMPKIERGLKDFKNQLTGEQVLIFQCNIAYLYFGSDQFKLSLKWLNYILQSENKYLREDVQSFVRILNLIIHFELEHTDVITYYERAANRFLTKKSRLLKIEKAILNFVGKKVHEIDMREELISAFVKLKVEVSEYLKNPIEKRNMEDFDILSWINSKIQNKTFAEIVREKARQKNS